MRDSLFQGLAAKREQVAAQPQIHPRRLEVSVGKRFEELANPLVAAIDLATISCKLS